MQNKVYGTSYPEQFIYCAFKQIYPDAINRFKTSNKIEYDIYIPSIRLAIEYGADYWHYGKEDIDQYKRDLAVRSGVRFIDIVEKSKGEVIMSKNHYEYNGSRKTKYKTVVSIINSILADYKHSVEEINFNEVKRKAYKYAYEQIEYTKSLAYLNPDIAKEWNYIKNGKLRPESVSPNSTMKVWWVCEKGHTWKASIINRTYRRTGCPYCNNPGKVKPGLNDITTTDKEILYDWDFELNEDLDPAHFTKDSREKVYWRCHRCRTVRKASISSFLYGKSFCPTCGAYYTKNIKHYREY